MSVAVQTEEWERQDVSVPDVAGVLAALRSKSVHDGIPDIRTSVMTHLAWAPEPWQEAARDTLANMNERHPSRTMLLFPLPDEPDGIDARVSTAYFPLEGLQVSAEVIELTLRGRRAQAPASIVEPLLIPELPVFCRWRGQPPFASQEWEQLLGVADRLIVDSTEWTDVPAAYADLVPAFERAAASDIAWARTGRWRALLASLWPEIAKVSQIRVKGTAAQAHLLAGWLRSRLGNEVALEHEPAKRLEGVDLDGEPAPFPPGDPPVPSDVLSDELDQFGRDPIYEAAVRVLVA